MKKKAALFLRTGKLHSDVYGYNNDKELLKSENSHIAKLIPHQKSPEKQIWGGGHTGKEEVGQSLKEKASREGWSSGLLKAVDSRAC